MTDRLTADCSTAELLRNMLLYSQQHDLSTEILVSVARIELALHAPKARVIPFHYTEKNWLHLLGSNQPLPVNSRGYSPRILRWNIKMVCVAGFEPATSDFQGRPSDQADNTHRNNMARELGIEPRLTESKSVVLPLHNSRTKTGIPPRTRTLTLRLWRPMCCHYTREILFGTHTR